MRWRFLTHLLTLSATAGLGCVTAHGNAVDCALGKSRHMYDPCSGLAAGASTEQLAELRTDEGPWIEAALAPAVGMGARFGRDHRAVFAGREPGAAAWATALADLDEMSLPYSTYSLALVCRPRCAVFRLELQRRLERWMRNDWGRAGVAAAALGFLGADASEAVLIEAVQQRRSRLLTVAALRAVGRLHAPSPRAVEAIERARAEHWSPRVREVAGEVLGWGTPGSGYRLLSRTVDETFVPRPGGIGLALFELGARLEPTISWVVGPSLSREDYGPGLTTDDGSDRDLAALRRSNFPEEDEDATGCLEAGIGSNSLLPWKGRQWALDDLDRLPNYPSRAAFMRAAALWPARWMIRYGRVDPSVVSLVGADGRETPVAEIPMWGDGRPILARAIDADTALVVTTKRAFAITRQGIEALPCQ
jgi:hypothetical protein